MRPDAQELFARPDQRDEAEELRQQESGLRARLDAITEAFAEGEIDRRSCAPAPSGCAPGCSE